jgi:hypothetical protein
VQPDLFRNLLARTLILMHPLLALPLSMFALSLPCGRSRCPRGCENIDALLLLLFDSFTWKGSTFQTGSVKRGCHVTWLHLKDRVKLHTDSVLRATSGSVVQHDSCVLEPHGMEIPRQCSPCNTPLSPLQSALVCGARVTLLHMLCPCMISVVACWPCKWPTAMSTFHEHTCQCP